MTNYSSMVFAEIVVIFAILILTSDRGQKLYYTLLGQTSLASPSATPTATPTSVNTPFNPTGIHDPFLAGHL